MIPVVRISQIIYARLQVKTIREGRQQREKERAKKGEKRVRDCVLLKVIVASLINLTVGQIPRSSMMDNPLEKNTT